MMKQVSKQSPRSVFAHLFLALVLSVQASTAAAHGGVAFEEDLCLINIEFLSAHFTVFQPETRDDNEYCENIPDLARSVFVMEYLHSMLPDMRVDFRIVKDVNEAGKFADWEDIEAIDDLEGATVFYERPRKEPGGFYTTSYSFEEKGTYIGVVTAEHPTLDRVYKAVFFFRVGGRDWGTLPLFALMLIALQSSYWLANGGMAKLKNRNKSKLNSLQA